LVVDSKSSRQSESGEERGLAALNLSVGTLIKWNLFQSAQIVTASKGIFRAVE
jgi:hypothetical protein